MHRTWRSEEIGRAFVLGERIPGAGGAAQRS